jgi:curved DNA-binding protein CbpA
MTNQLNYFAHAALGTLYTLHLTRPSRLVLSPKVTPTPDYYAVLGLSRDASEQEINRAWRKAVLLHHPDKRQALSNDQHDNETESARTGVDIRLINEAKWILSDSHRRKDWEDRLYSSGMSVKHYSYHLG